MCASAKTWGVTEAEREMEYPSDRLEGKFDEAYFRGVSVKASPETLFRWLCQLRAAPYSYDWLDNFGRKSPDTLTPGLDQLETGQRVMLMFELVDFEKDRYITIQNRKGFPGGLMGDVVICYLVHPKGPAQCRFLAKIVIRHPGSIPGVLIRFVLPVVDLIMMRKELLTLKKYAEIMQKVQGRAK